jgi:hypothetical protein
MHSARQVYKPKPVETIFIRALKVITRTIDLTLSPWRARKESVYSSTIVFFGFDNNNNRSNGKDILVGRNKVLYQVTGL